MDPILDIARQRGITVIEDASQAHGATYKKRMVGSLGDMACFSFYAGKNMTTGEGGMITTNDDELARTLRMIRTHGEERPYWITRLGSNYHMTEIAAAIGIAQLAKLPTYLENRDRNAKLMSEHLGTSAKLITPVETEDRAHSWHLYTVKVKGANAGKRNKIIDRVRNKDVEASIYYETPVHMLPLYRDLFGGRRGMLPETEKAARQVIQLPIHSGLSQEELDYVADTFKKIVG
jgi:dTDP-4-amino-4,6-dideoxygalactose transaminase